MNNYLLNEAGKFTIDSIFQAAIGKTVDTAIDKLKGTPSKEYSYSSVANAASNLIAVFPVLTSRTVSVDTAHKVSKYIEQVSCHFITLALQQANIDTAESGISYLKKFHQNVDIGGNGVDAVIGAMDSWVNAANEIAAIPQTFSRRMINEYTDKYLYYDMLLEADNDLQVSPAKIRALMDQMKSNEKIKEYYTELSDLSINDYSVDRNDNLYNISTRHYGINEANSNRSNNQSKSVDTEKENDVLNSRIQSGRNVSILKDQDIKKMNDAVPSILVIKFYHRDKSGRVSTVPTEFIVGVKSKIIPVTTEEVLRRIMNDNKDGKKFINFMRTITGELKASELIFGLSRIKDDVQSCKVKGAYGDTWNLLANRAMAAREQVKRGQRNDFSAISTLVISQYDADELFREENFDITDPSNAYHFMKSYNLMAFAICDDATESLKILFDNDSKSFDEISYRMLERETQQDAVFKKLITLMAASR